MHLLKRLLEYVQVQLVSKLCILEHGDELDRRQQTTLGVVPACKCLFVANLAGCRSDDGLVMHVNPPFGNGAIYVVDDVLPALKPLAKVFVEIATSRGWIELKLITGHFRAVTRCKTVYIVLVDH